MILEVVCQHSTGDGCTFVRFSSTRSDEMAQQFLGATTLAFQYRVEVTHDRCAPFLYPTPFRS